MLDDPTLRTDVDARIDSGATAERAVHEAFGVFRDMFAGMGEYMAGRVVDLDDMSRRAVARISGVAVPGVPESDTPYVLVARDLAPADTALLDAKLVLAIVTAEGGPTSHTAILAGEKGIPAVVGVTGARDIAEGTTVIVDAGSSEVVVDPTPDALAAARRKVADRAARVHATGPGALSDGTRIPLLANLGSAAGVESAVAAGAEGVGLLRTEFLFLGSDAAPTVEADDRVLGHPHRVSRQEGRRARSRRGSRQAAEVPGRRPEENPALGLRGIRSLRASEQILRDQLSALAAAQDAHEAEVWVMAPMVATVEETRYFTSLAKELGLKTAGVMVEVPAAALLADRILRVADFASVGTNDLTQYTMAADRMLGSVGSFHDPWHPAVLKLVAAIGAAGATLGKPVGVCGEAAADPKLRGSCSSGSARPASR